MATLKNKAPRVGLRKLFKRRAKTEARRRVNIPTKLRRWIYGRQKGRTRNGEFITSLWLRSLMRDHA